MDFGVYGTDIEPRMIEYSRDNIEWLKRQQPWLAKNIDAHHSTHVFLEVQDATKFQNHDVFDAVASETYLGRPFTTLPSPAILVQTASECDLIIKKFLQAIAPEIAPGHMRLCLAVPAWQVKPGQFKYLPLIDQLAELGYNRISFEHVRDKDLIYYRADQVVARQLLVIEKR